MTTATTFTVGRIESYRDGQPRGRALMADGIEIGRVTSDAGPSIVGTITTDEVRAQFGSQIERTWEAADRSAQFGW